MLPVVRACGSSGDAHEVFCGVAFINLTSIPDDLVREVLRFVVPPGVHGVEVKVAKARGRKLFSGRAYVARPGYVATRPPRVLLCIGRAKLFPLVAGAPRGRGGYLPIPALSSQVEALVYVAAHELRHVWQSRVTRGRRVWGARGQYSERDADAYAIHMLREWRRSGRTVSSGSFAALYGTRVFPDRAAA